jgi:hypothetical protein
MKKTLSLILSCFLFAITAAAQADKPAVMTVGVPGMDAAIADKAVAAVSAVPGVLAVKPDIKKGQIKIDVKREGRAESRKAVRKALKDAGIKFVAGKDLKEASDKASNKGAGKKDKKKAAM